MSLLFEVVTIFPGIFSGPLGHGMIGRASRQGLVDVRLHDLRDFASDRHRSVDDAPFGGGGGMVFKPEPLFRAVESLAPDPQTPILLPDPQGPPLTQERIERFAGHPRLVVLCCRYEGVDERVRQTLVTEEFSLGDYVISGGELAALVFLEAVTRLLPGATGCEESVRRDSFSSGLLDHPHYTRPASFRGMEVPSVLVSGDHARVERWRQERALENTRRRRPDLYRAWLQRGDGLPPRGERGDPDPAKMDPRTGGEEKNEIWRRKGHGCH
jgi:tRNA (guanine37-N1)-methyltransferase